MNFFFCYYLCYFVTVSYYLSLLCYCTSCFVTIFVIMLLCLIISSFVLPLLCLTLVFELFRCFANFRNLLSIAKKDGKGGIRENFMQIVLITLINSPLVFEHFRCFAIFRNLLSIAKRTEKAEYAKTLCR